MTDKISGGDLTKSTAINSKKMIKNALNTMTEETISKSRGKFKRSRVVERAATVMSRNKMEKENNGWYNLVKLLMCLFVGRFILLNIMEHGFIMKLPFSSISFNEAKWFCVCLFIIFLRCCFGYPLARLKIPLKFGTSYILIAECFSLIIARSKINHVFLSCWYYILSISYNMKLYSFLCNYEKSNGKNSFKALLKFLSFPTLVYKEQYQTKPKMNIKLLRNSIAKLMFFLILLCFIIDQHAIPAIIKLVQSTTLDGLSDGFLQLSISSIVLFNLFFKVFFDYGMNILSEITYFDERMFGDWWNSRSIGDFWRNWNLPVHDFMKEHIYIPLVNGNVDRSTAMFICFLFSGFIHEYVVSMTLRFFNGWFLYGMVVQIPLYYITNVVKERIPSAANTFFWVCFCVVGQPVGMFLICKGKYNKNDAYLIGSSGQFDQ